MYRFDRAVIDPTADALSRVLAEACAAANKGCRARLLSWPVEDFAGFVADWRAAPVGQRQWIGPGKYRKPGPDGDTRSAAAVVWWSDPLSRKHCRVVGDRVDCGDALEEDLFAPDRDRDREGKERPPLWRVYPDDLYLRERERAWSLWAVCRCGAAGPPEQLGWMGPWCAACHDRSEEGTPLSRPGTCPAVVYSGHSYWVTDVAFVLGGQAPLARARYDSGVSIWDLATAVARKLPFQSVKGTGFVVSADGAMAAACVDATVRVWSIENEFDLLAVALDGRGQADCSFAFSPDGSSLALAWCRSFGSITHLEVRDIATGAQRWQIRLGRLELLREKQCLAFSPDGRILALGSPGTVDLWDAADGTRLPNRLSVYASGSAVAFSPDGKTLATSADRFEDHQLSLWDMESRRPLASLPGPVGGLAFSPDGRTLAAVGRDGCLRLRDGHSGKLFAAYRWHQADINAVAFSPDGRWLATGADEDRVKLWPVEGLLQGD